MALDEALLEEVERAGQPCWRFYRWAEPTLSLGYFQPSAERREHPASAACTLVRRLTGGGAILHDGELTYSLTVPAGHPLAHGRDRLYRLVHTALIETLANTFSLHAELCSGTPATGDAEPFLCFQRRSLGDVLLGDWKIAGSAQRRRRGAVLQHGSLLLRRSACAPELPGLEDLSGQTLPLERLISAWLERLTAGLALAFQPSAVSVAEQRLAEQYAAARYTRPAWNDLRR